MKLRWFPHLSNNEEKNTTAPIFVYSEFTDPENDPFKFRYWGQVAYLPEADCYGAVYYSKDRVYRTTDRPFDDIYEAMRAVEQQLFEEGIREDDTA